MSTQRNQKDTVYRMLFREPENALSLYNGLNGTEYTDVSELEFNTLENAIYMGMKNDLSFLIMDQMHLYEQQSTFTPNMPLRDLFYVADLLQANVKDKTLYSSRQIKIPTPHFVVFYNGVLKQPERMELKLSDAFEVQTKHPELELKVQMFNINSGMNEALKEKCSALREYMIYVEKIRSYTRIMPLEEAVEKSVDECIQDNVLREFLRRQRAEVVKMSIYEYDEERELKLIRADEREIGKEIGREEERKNTEAVRVREIENVISLCREFGSTKDETVTKLIEKCKLDKKTAEEKVMQYWN